MDRQYHFRVLRIRAGGSNLVAFTVFNLVEHGVILIRTADKTAQSKGGIPGVRELRCDHESGGTVIVKVKMLAGHRDQVHTAVQAAVEREVGMVRIDIGSILIAHTDGEQVCAILTAEVCDISPEEGVATLVVHSLLSVDIHGGHQGSGRDLHIQPAAGERLVEHVKGSVVPVASAVILADRLCGKIAGGPVRGRNLYGMPVMAVNGIPGMWQCDGCGVVRNHGRIAVTAVYEVPGIKNGLSDAHGVVSFQNCQVSSGS